MTRARRDLKLKKLRSLLSETNDDEFLSMAWAIDAMQSGRHHAATRYLSFPSEAATDEITSPFAIHPWELETLVGLLLTTSKIDSKRKLNCSSFGNVTQLINLLRSIEDSEYNIYSRAGKIDILAEIHRISQRQFGWQQGFFNVIDLYRYAYIYSQGDCASYFLEKNGISINSFSLIGVALYILFLDRPRLNINISMDILEISSGEIEKSLALFTNGAADASRSGARQAIRDVETKIRGTLPVAYRPSVLRRWPIIRSTHGQQILAPIPELIIQRVTSGIFYDIVDGDASLRNGAAERFESYSRRLFKSALPRESVAASYYYTYGRNRVQSPDLFLKNSNGEIVSVVECKAKRLTVAARFADDPIVEAKRDFDEIVKGIVQIWRFFSRARTGHAARDVISSDAVGIVLTLDPWFLVSNRLLELVFVNARAKAKDDHTITDEDCRPVIVCSTECMESTLFSCTHDQFFETLKAAVEKRFFGWLLSQVNREIHNGQLSERSFPFDLEEVLPWKGQLDRLVKNLTR